MGEIERGDLDKLPLGPQALKDEDQLQPEVDDPVSSQPCALVCASMVTQTVKPWFPTVLSGSGVVLGTPDNEIDDQEARASSSADSFSRSGSGCSFGQPSCPFRRKEL